HAVVDEHPAADGRPGMDLHPGKEAPEVRGEPGQPLEPAPPQGVREAMELERVEPRITSEHFPHRPGGRVTLENALDVLAGSSEHGGRSRGDWTQSSIPD